MFFYNSQATSHTIPLPAGEGLGVGLSGVLGFCGAFYKIYMKIEIDEGSGFCFGVTTAIKKAEEELAGGNTLYCLGDIVHNGM